MDHYHILQPIIGTGEDNVLFYEMLLDDRSVPVGFPNKQAYFKALEATGEIKAHNLEQIKHSLEFLERFPDKVSVNVSMQTLLDTQCFDQLTELLQSKPDAVREKLVLEITEYHQPHYDMGQLESAIKKLRDQNCEIALDDLNITTDARDPLVGLPEIKYRKLEKSSWDFEKDNIAKVAGLVGLQDQIAAIQSSTAVNDIKTINAAVSRALERALKTWIANHKGVDRCIIFEGAGGPDHLEKAWKLGADACQVQMGTLALSPDLKISAYYYPGQARPTPPKRAGLHP